MVCKTKITQALFLLLVASIFASVYEIPHIYAEEIKNTSGNQIEPQKKSLRSKKNNSFFELLSHVHNTDHDNSFLWKILENSSFILSSDSPKSSFHFEYYQYAPPSKPTINTNEYFFARALMDCHNSQNSALFFSGSIKPPIAYFCEDGILTFSNNYSEHKFVPHERWGYVFDQEHLTDPFDTKFAPEKFTGFLRFDLLSCINWLMHGVTPSVHWENVTQTLILKKPSGTKVQIRFRSPSDMLRYGTELGEFRILDSKQAIIDFRSFQMVPSISIRLPPVDTESVKTKLLVVNEQERKPGKEYQTLPELLWYATTSFHPFGESIDFSEIKNYQELNARERLVYLVTMCLNDPLNPSRSPNGSQYLPPEKIEKIYFNLFVHQFKFMTLWIAQNSLNAGVYPDDPAMIWRELEAAFGPDELTSFVHLGLKYILYNQSVAPTLKIEFLDALGDWGHPPFLDNEKTWNVAMNINGNPFHEAILWSHWQWPCEQKHREACVKASRISKNGSETERVATETLIRLDAIPLLLKKVMERWYQSQIAQTGPAERRINLSLLSLQHTGRSYLLNRLKTKVDTVGIQSDIAKVLQSRAQATLKTKRFDFITEGRCNEILAVTGPILGSAN